MDDERVVREIWESVNWGSSNYEGTEFGVVLYDDEEGTGFKAKTQAEAWAAARAFTEARQEEVRTLDSQIAWVEGCDNCFSAGITKRLRDIRAGLVQGMRTGGGA